MISWDIQNTSYISTLFLILYNSIHFIIKITANSGLLSWKNLRHITIENFKSILITISGDRALAIKAKSILHTVCLHADMQHH